MHQTLQGFAANGVLRTKRHHGAHTPHRPSPSQTGCPFFPIRFERSLTSTSHQLSFFAESRTVQGFLSLTSCSIFGPVLFHQLKGPLQIGQFCDQVPMGAGHVASPGWPRSAPPNSARHQLRSLVPWGPWATRPRKAPLQLWQSPPETRKHTDSFGDKGC